MNTPSDTVQAAQRLLEEREAVGLKKYGTTVDRTDLQAGDWLQHAIEEASDLLLYLLRLQQAATGLMPRYTSPFSSDGNCAPAPDAERAARIARWANAPAEATHLAQELDGMCHWFSSCPQQGISGYWHGEPLAVAEPNLLGHFRCEQRPTLEGGQGVGP